jgi:CheY-like chemotaxis protein
MRSDAPCGNVAGERQNTPVPATRQTVNQELWWVTGMRILIVDDNRIFQILSAQSLKKLRPDAQIVLADDGLEALAQFREQPFDLIVTDYNIPGMNGLDLAQAIRQIAPDTQIVLATLEDAVVIRAEAQRRHLNLDGYLDKPYTLTQLQTVFKSRRSK